MKLTKRLKQTYQCLLLKNENQISKKELLAGIESGLKDLKTYKKTPAREFLEELKNKQNPT